MNKLIAAFLFLSASGFTLAAEVSGVRLEDGVSLDNVPLSLNGAGVRKKFGLVSVYVAALYLPSKTGNADSAIHVRQPRRMLMVMKRSVDSESLLEAMHDGLEANLGSEELAKLAPKLARLDMSFKGLDARENDRISLDVGADESVRIIHNDRLKDTLPGPDIGPAMLKIWLGKKPVQDDLKKNLLGE